VPAYFLRALSYSLTSEDGALIWLHAGHGYGFTPAERKTFLETGVFV
jgi:hypothetical protein